MRAEEKRIADVVTLLQRSRDQLAPVTDHYLTDFYTARGGLADAVAELDAIASGRADATTKSLGDALERVVYLLFRGTSGVTGLLSVFTSGPQYDLLVEGDTIAWRALSWLMGVDPAKPCVLVEAKNKATPADVTDVVRLSGLLRSHMDRCGLGVLVSVNGISGGDMQGLRHGREHQVIVYARHRLPIIVLDLADLKQCMEPGSFLRLMARKIAELDRRSRPSDLDPERLARPRFEVLPKHLRDLDPFT